MNLASVNKVLTFVGRLSDPRHATEAYLPVTGDKPVFQDSTPEKPYFPRVSPEEAGMSSACLAHMIKELAENPGLNMHSATILRGGRVLCEATFGAQDRNIWKYTFSGCKTIVGLAVGILFGQKLLSPDDRISELFSDKLNAVTRLRFANITVRDLLTMRSGIIFNEVEAMVETDWLRAWLNSGVQNENVFDPHAVRPFVYNSMNTFLLSEIVVRKSGKSLSDFLRENLFGPMGITRFYWEKCPDGSAEKGGWGLYILPEDMAKLGVLCMQGGVWEGRQLVPAEYLRQAMSVQTVTPQSTGTKAIHYSYGYQMWVGTSPRSFLFNGMLGQNVLGFPDTGILVVANAGNGEMFQQSDFYEIVTRYCKNAGEDKPLPYDRDGAYALASALLSIREHTEEESTALEESFAPPAPEEPKSDIQPAPEPDTTETQKKTSADGFFARLSRLFRRQDEDTEKAAPADTADESKDERNVPVPAEETTEPTQVSALPEEARRLAGRSFRVRENEPSQAAGLLPAILQLMQNNYTRGLLRISFSVRKNSAGKEHLFVTFTEQEAAFVFPVGFEKSLRVTLYFRGEPFLCAVRGAFTHDEDENPVFRIRLDFLETPCTRIMKLFFLRDGSVLLRLEETPGERFIYENVIAEKNEIAAQPVFGAALEKIENDYLEYKVRRMMSPELMLDEESAV